MALNELPYGEDEDDCDFHKVEGMPDQLQLPNERTRWHRFKAFFTPWFLKRAKQGADFAKHGAEVAMLFKDAKLKQESGKGDQELEKAALIHEQTKKARVENTKQIFDLIGQATKSNPKLGEGMKLAALLNDHPEIEAQFKKVGEMIDKLEQRGTRIDIEEDATAIKNETLELSASTDADKDA